MSVMMIVVGGGVLLLGWSVWRIVSKPERRS